MTEDFGTFSGSRSYHVGRGGVSQEIRSQATGFTWTAFAGDEFFAFLSDASTGGKTVVDTRASASMVGSYTYTLFDVDADGVPDKLLDHLQSVTIDWENVDPEVGDGAVRILIRAADGKWYLSDSELGIANRLAQTLSLDSSQTWSEIASDTTLDDVTDDNTGPLAIGSSGLHPDLSTVSGGGIYFSRLTNPSAAVVRIAAVRFKGVTWDMESLARWVAPMQTDASTWTDRHSMHVWQVPLPEGDELAALRESGALGTHIDTLTTRGFLPHVIASAAFPTARAGELAMAAVLHEKDRPIDVLMVSTPRRECDLWPDAQYWIEPSATTTPPVTPSGIAKATFDRCPRGDSWPSFPMHDTRGGAEKIRERLQGFADAGYTVSALWTDDEGQPYPWGGALASQKVASQRGYYANVPLDLNDVNAFREYTLTLRRDLHISTYLNPLRSLFPSAIWGNYGGYASGSAAPFIDQNGVSYPPLAYEDGAVTMPACYANTRLLKNHFPGRSSVSQDEADALYLHVMLRTFSTNSVNVPAVPYPGDQLSNLNVVPYVSPYVPDVTEAPYGSLGMSRTVYREFLRHVWLRGADSMFLFNPGMTNAGSRFEPPGYGMTPYQAFESMEDARAVYAEVLSWRSFLNTGTPLSFNVPEMRMPGALSPGVLWSALRKPDGSCLVRAITVGSAESLRTTINGCGNSVSLEVPPAGQYYLIESGTARAIGAAQPHAAPR